MEKYKKLVKFLKSQNIAYYKDKDFEIHLTPKALGVSRVPPQSVLKPEGIDLSGLKDETLPEMSETDFLFYSSGIDDAQLDTTAPKTKESIN